MAGNHRRHDDHFQFGVSFPQLDAVAARVHVLAKQIVAAAMPPLLGQNRLTRLEHCAHLINDLAMYVGLRSLFSSASCPIDQRYKLTLSKNV